jgi:hypothetical protein
VKHREHAAHKWEKSVQASQSAATPPVVGILEGKGIAALHVIDVLYDTKLL